MLAIASRNGLVVVDDDGDDDNDYDDDDDDVRLRKIPRINISPG